MNLNLLIPDLFWPDSSQTEIYNDLSVRSLEVLLSKNSSTMNPPQEIETWLCKEFNVAKQKNDWPIAPLLLLTDAPALAKTSKDFWMRADPVHLRIEQNHIMLADSQAFQISIEEAEQIVQDLNHNLGNHDFSFFPLHPDRWYIRTPKAPEIFTHTLSHVTCKNINNFLPTGSEMSTRLIKLVSLVENCPLIAFGSGGEEICHNQHNLLIRMYGVMMTYRTHLH